MRNHQIVKLKDAARDTWTWYLAKLNKHLDMNMCKRMYVPACLD